MATRALAEAERQLLQGRAVMAEADGRLADARTGPIAVPARGGALTDGRWHRSWIVRLEVERRGAVERVRMLEAGVALALAARRRTHQRLESLDRFREKARDRHDETAEAAEQKLLDALATMRYTAARRA